MVQDRIKDVGNNKNGLLEIANQMYIDGMICDNQKHGLIVRVPKKLRPIRPDDLNI